MKIRKRRRWGAGQRGREAQAQSGGKREAEGKRPPPTTQAAAPIRKGIYLSALIYVEGEQAPAEDFDGVAREGVKKVLAAAMGEGKEGGLKMTLKGVEVRNDVEEDGKGEGEKFQF